MRSLALYASMMIVAVLLASPAAMAYGSTGYKDFLYPSGGFSITGYAVVSCSSVGGMCIDSYSCYEECRSRGKSMSCTGGTTCADCCCVCYTPATTTVPMPVSALQINYTGVLQSNGELIWRTDTYHYAERVLIKDKYFDETLKSVTIGGDAVNISAGDIVYELTFKDAMNLGLFGRGTVVMPEYTYPVPVTPLGVQLKVAGVQSNQFLLLYGVLGSATATVPVTYGDYSLYSDLGSSDSWARVIIKDRSNNVVDTLVINQYSDKTSVAAGLTVKVTAVRTLLDGTIVGTDLIVGAMNTIEKIYPQNCDISGTGSSDYRFPGTTEWCIQVLGGAQAGKISAGDKIYVVFKPISSRTYSAGGSIVLPNGAGTITFGTQSSPATTTTTTTTTQPVGCSLTEYYLSPYYADVPKCTASNGVAYQTTNVSNPATWFLWNGCAREKIYSVNPGEMLRIQVWTDRASCQSPNFKLYEWDGNAWKLQKSFALGYGAGEKFNEYYVPAYDRVRFVSDGGCFYLWLYSPTQVTGAATQRSTGSADLLMERVVHSPAIATAGLPITVNYTVINIGEAASGDFKVCFYDGQSGLDTASALPSKVMAAKSLAPGESITGTFNWTYTATGTYNFALRADCADSKGTPLPPMSGCGSVKENYETNNLLVPSVRLDYATSTVSTVPSATIITSSTTTTTIPPTTTTTTIPQPTQCAIGTATAASSVSYGNYRIYSDLGGNSVWARVIVKNQYGSVISTVTINQGSSYDFTSLGFSVKVITVRALQDGTIVGTDISVSAIASGTATATNGVQISQYKLYSDSASNAVWARIVVKDKSGSAVATAVINQGSSYNFISLGITVKVVAVRALQDGTVAGVDVYAIQLCPSTTTTIPATCSDTDGGLNYITKGTCTSRDNGDNYDVCDGITTLSEAYCSTYEEAIAKYGADYVHGPMCFRKAVDCAAAMGTGYVCLRGECVNPIGLTRYNPSVVLLPSSSASGMETVEYTVFVKNNDYGKTSSRFELKCNVNDIGVQSGVRCGFVTASGTVARTVVTINPGEATYTPLKVWTTSEKLSETIGFNVTATNTEDTKYWAVAVGTAHFGAEETNPSAGKGTEGNPVKYGDYTIYSDLGRTDSWARIVIKDAAGNIVDTLLINQGSDKTSVATGLVITLTRVEAVDTGEIISADFTVKSMGTSTATASTPVVYGTYSIYSDLGMADTWARIIIKDASEKTIDTLVINQGESKTSGASGLKITVVAVAAKQDGTIIGTEIVVNKNTNTATPTTPVIYGEYSIYSDLGMASMWARVIIKDSAGKTVDTLVINQGESKISETSGLEISVITVTAKQDGTIVGTDLVIKSAVTGTATATIPVTYGDYRIYSDLGATDSWARIIIKDTTGETVDTKNVNQRESWNSGGSGLHIAVVKVRATQDGTIVGVDLIVNTASTGASSTATKNPVVKFVRDFYSWLSNLWKV